MRLHSAYLVAFLFYYFISSSFPVALYHAFPDIFHLFACFIVLCWLVAVVVLCRVYVVGCFFIVR